MFTGQIDSCNGFSSQAKEEEEEGEEDQEALLSTDWISKLQKKKKNRINLNSKLNSWLNWMEKSLDSIRLFFFQRFQLNSLLEFNHNQASSFIIIEIKDHCYLLHRRLGGHFC